MNETDLQDYIRESARDDGQYAIAYALLQLATQVKYLGGGDNASTMGAVEFLAVRLGEKLDEVAAALRDVARSIEEHRS